MSEITATTLPAGVVTFLFTDIEGSTRLLAKLDDDYAELLSQHHALLREIWQDFGGHEIDAVGDSFLVVFPQADAALEAACTAQQEIAATAWHGGCALRVRMGLHTGYARPRGGRYVAMAVHQAARIINATHGGQILLSQTSWEALEPDQADELEALGRFRVRDFEQPLALYRVRAQGWQDHRNPPRLRPAETHNLVRPANPFMGREEVLAQLRERVRPGSLNTLVGPGGMGKTRLATEYGLTVSDDWPDGVWLVALEALRDSERLVQTVAEAVGIPLTPDRPARDVLIEALTERRLLLIVDNCEHLLAESGALISQLLTLAPDLAILATSQAPLGLRGERVLRLPPLQAISEAAHESAALALFLERANGVPEHERDAAAELCCRLDGLPLAIELAAARAASIPPSAILAQLDKSLDLLEIADPGLPARHRSLTSVLRWSVGLLRQDEREVLEATAIFASDFGLEAAQAVAASENCNAATVAVLLWSLVDKSLVIPDTAAGGSRFRLALSVKTATYAALSAERQADIIRRAGSYYLERFPPEDMHRLHWHQQLQGEIDNLRGLIPDLLRHEPETGFALATSAVGYDDRHGARSVAARAGQDWLKASRHEGPMRVALLDRSIKCLHEAGETAAAQALLDEALAVKQRVGAPPQLPSALRSSQALLALHRGDFSGAHQALEEGLREACCPQERARLKNSQGMICCGEGDFSGAELAFQAALEAAAEAENEIDVVILTGNLAELALRRGDVGTAAARQLESLESARSLDSPLPLANALLLAARLIDAEAEAATAAAFNAAGLGIYAEIGTRLYDDDQQLVDALNAQLQDRLGAQAHAQAVASGLSWSRSEAADRASAALRDQIRISAPRPLPPE